MKAYTIDIDGTVTEAIPANGKEFMFDELYPLVGCEEIQIVGISDLRIMVLDYNGTMNKKPINIVATLRYMWELNLYTNAKGVSAKKYWGRQGVEFIQLGPLDDCNTIVGKVLVCPVEMVK